MGTAVIELAGKADPDANIFRSLPIQRIADPSTRPLFHNHMAAWSLLLGIGIFFFERNAQLTCTLSWREGSLDAGELVTLRRQLLDDLGVKAPFSP